MKESRAISKTFKFECSHRLNLNYSSPCLSLHGHSYKVKLTIKVSDYLNENEMIIDFSQLKRFQDYLDDQFDHAVLVSKDDKELLEFVQNNKQKHVILDSITTSEKIAEYLAYNVYEVYEPRIPIKKLTVTIWETENNEATFTMEV